MKQAAIEIVVGDVNDIEARVYARYVGASGGVERVVLRGTLRGPYCEISHTLPAVVEFRDSGRPGMAEALIPDPCIWSPELPHLYQAHIEARSGDEVLAEFCGSVGLRRSRLGARRSSND